MVTRLLNPFLIVGATELYLATWLRAGGWPVLAGLCGWAGLATAWVGLAYLLNRPGLLSKRAPAPIRWVARLLLLPYFLSAWGTAWVGVRSMRAARTELAPGLWVGGWPLDGAPGMARLDLTAELPISPDPLPSRRCVPMLDGVAPPPEVFAEAVAAALALRAEGRPVLVHCAYGHGRSVMVCLAVLVAEGAYPGWEEAHACVLRLRPRARMSAVQRAFLSAHPPGQPPD